MKLEFSSLEKFDELEREFKRLVPMMRKLFFYKDQYGMYGIWYRNDVRQLMIEIARLATVYQVSENIII